MRDSELHGPSSHEDELEDELDLEVADEDDDQVEQAWERFRAKFLTRQFLVLGIIFIVVTLVFLYIVLPQLPGIQDSIETVRDKGDRSWLFLALLFEVLAYAAYIWFLGAVYLRKIPVIGWSGSYQISLSGVAATRLFGAAGVGGIALMFWATRKAGMGRRESVSYLVAFHVLLYGVFMAPLVIVGLLLRMNLIPGPSPFGVTVIPALLGVIVITLFLAALLVPHNLERIAARWSDGRGRAANLARKAAAIPALIGNGTRVAIDLIRHRDPGLLGAIGWWAFNILVLWACFRAFGQAPEAGVLIMGFLVGMIANLLPSPGGVGTVEGGMIGTFAAFGVSLDTAVLAVLAYRVFAFILPTIPGVFSFLHLRRDVVEWQAEIATIKSKALDDGRGAEA